MHSTVISITKQLVNNKEVTFKKAFINIICEAILFISNNLTNDIILVCCIIHFQKYPQCDFLI